MVLTASPLPHKRDMVDAIFGEPSGSVASGGGHAPQNQGAGIKSGPALTYIQKEL